MLCILIKQADDLAVLLIFQWCYPANLESIFSRWSLRWNVLFAEKRVIQKMDGRRGWIFFLFFIVLYFLFLIELCWGKAMVAYRKPQQRRMKEESERLRGERDEIRFIDLRFDRCIVTGGLLRCPKSVCFSGAVMRESISFQIFYSSSIS